MIRASLIGLGFMVPALAGAHGPVAGQAATAVQRSIQVFLKDEPVETQARFASVSATIVGEESFRVEVKLQDGKTLTYQCGLNTSVKPVKWGCQKT